MNQEREWLFSPSPPTACGCWGGSCWPKLTFFSSEDRLLERWRQQESLRQLRRETEREKELREMEQKRERKERMKRKLEERRRQQERERQKEIEMVQWRLQMMMEQKRMDKEERQELLRLRELEKELQLKELREREKERKERERQPSTRKELRGSVRDREIRGVEEIIRKQETEILRCRERGRELKREAMDEAHQDTGSGKENKNKRMSIIGWINEKVKEKHQKSIEKSYKREAEFGHHLFTSSAGIVTMAELKAVTLLTFGTPPVVNKFPILNPQLAKPTLKFHWRDSRAVWSLTKDPEKF
ncbi:hypothetical protein MHYP_G00150500 [Metynnis hypsauchen]